MKTFIVSGKWGSNPRPSAWDPDESGLPSEQKKGPLMKTLIVSGKWGSNPRPSAWDPDESGLPSEQKKVLL